MSPQHAFHDVFANYYASNPGSHYSNVHCRLLAQESLVLLSLVPRSGSSGFCSMAQLKSMGASSSESEEMAGPQESTSAQPLSAFAFPDRKSAHKAALAAASSVLKKPLAASLETTPPAKRSCPVHGLLSTEKGLKPGGQEGTLSKKKPADTGEGAIPGSMKQKPAGAITGPMKQKPAGAITGPLKKKPAGAIPLPLMRKPSCNEDGNDEEDEEEVVEAGTEHGLKEEEIDDGKKDGELEEEEEEEEEEAKEQDEEEEEMQAKKTNDKDLPATFAGRRRPEKNPELFMKLQKFYCDIPAESWKSEVVKDREFWKFMRINMKKAWGNADQKFEQACLRFTQIFLN